MNSVDPATSLHQTLTATARSFAGDQGIEPSMDVPPKAELGDYSSNAAMLMAKGLGRAPRDIAVELADRLSTELTGTVERIEVAGPGFINLFLCDGWYRTVVQDLVFKQIEVAGNHLHWPLTEKCLYREKSV